MRIVSLTSVLFLRGSSNWRRLRPSRSALAYWNVFLRGMVCERILLSSLIVYMVWLGISIPSPTLAPHATSINGKFEYPYCKKEKTSQPTSCLQFFLINIQKGSVICPKAVPSKLQVPLPVLSPRHVDFKPQRGDRLLDGPGFERSAEPQKLIGSQVVSLPNCS